MSSEITAALADLGLDVNVLDQAMSGRLDFEWRPGGRPMQQLYVKFHEINVIQINDTWEVSCLMEDVDGSPGRAPLGISVDSSTVSMDQSGNHYTFGVNDPRVKVVSSPSSGQLVIRFLANVAQPSDPRAFIAQGSFVFVKA
jgi:hypothetical protein